MSTSQITGRNGVLQFAPDDSYKPDPNKGLIQCESCEKYFAEDFMIDVKLCNGKLTKTVCLDCYERKYDFYDENLTDIW